MSKFLRLLVEAEIKKLKQQPVIVWHSSPDANIQKFKPPWIPRYKQYGLFVSPKFTDQTNEWLW